MMLALKTYHKERIRLFFWQLQLHRLLSLEILPKPCSMGLGHWIQCIDVTTLLETELSDTRVNRNDIGYILIHPGLEINEVGNELCLLIDPNILLSVLAIILLG